MSRLAPRPEEVLERGTATFYYRPRVEQQQVDDLGDVQRMQLLLSPSRSAWERLVVIGRKRVPASAARERFWGFVDLVLSPVDMQAALGPQVYNTRTRGLRHLPASRQFASGAYSIARHDDHAHLRWTVDSLDEDDPVARELELERDADWLVTVASPDPAAWGLEEPPDLQQQLFDELEVHVTLPAPFPPALQARFGGRRFARLDAVDWLDHPGAELVFIGTRSG